MVNVERQNKNLVCILMSESIGTFDERQVLVRINLVFICPEEIQFHRF